MDNLTQVQEFLSEIYTINWGGCGISALAMYRWLKDNNKLVGDERFVYLYVLSDTNYHTNESVLAKIKFNPRRKKKLGSASHVMLYHNGQLHDSNGSFVPDRYIRKHDHISEKHLIESLNFGSWNCDFERETYIPSISTVLNVDLSDVNFAHA